MGKKLKEWTEGELIATFGLNRYVQDLDASPLMKDWLNDIDTDLSRCF